MNDLSRRRFLAHSSIAAMAGALAALPGMAGMFKLPPSSAGWNATTAFSEPLVAHVRDVATGEISLLVGTTEVIHRDRDLAVRLYAAARRS